MASVFRKTKPNGQLSPYWYADYRDAKGRRIKKSTKQSEKAAAMEVCLGWAHAEKEAAKGRLTRERAREILSGIVARTHGEQLDNQTAREWLETWKENKKATKAKSTVSEYGGVVKSFLKSLGRKADDSLELVETRDVLAWREMRIKDGIHPTTINNQVKILRMPFAVAVDQGILKMNPAGARNVEPLPAANKLQKATFAIEDVQRLLEVATLDWQGAILMAFYTGGRLRDITNMRWASVDLHKRTISFVPMKTENRGPEGKRVTVPIHPKLEAHLIALDAPDSGQAFLFPTLAGRGTGGKGGPGTKGGLSLEFRAILERVGFKPEFEYSDADGKGRKIVKLSFHSFRHSFNSALANAGIAQELRQELTGHASAEVNKLYTHHEIERLRNAVNVLP